MLIERIDVSRINPAPYNPRKDLKPSDPEYQALVRNMDEFGLVQPLVWNRRTGNLVGGHQRFKVLLARGEKEVDAVVVDLPLEKEKVLNLSLNRISGEWDRDKLAELLSELVTTADLDVELTGFGMSEIEELIASLGDDIGPEDLLGADEDQPAITQPGELIELGLHGEHRIVCGDALDPKHLMQLLGECRASMVHTDPPYGVSYDRNNRPKAPGSREEHSRPIANDDLSPSQYRRWFERLSGVLHESSIPGAPFYIWNSHRNIGLMHELLGAQGFKVASLIVWAKESFSPGFGDYNEQVEYAVYGWKAGKGVRHPWYGPSNASTLWQVHRDRTQDYHHPTQKPLELAERAIRNSSKRGEIVFDPFLGSGTTLIAAARLGRRCMGFEIDPRYVDVIVRRYIALAGVSAVTPEIAQRYAAGQEVSL